MDEIECVEVGNELHFSCGCKIKGGGENLFMVACSPDCEVLKYALEKAMEHGHVISEQVVDDEK